MKYEMSNSAKTVEEKTDEILKAASDNTFEKYMPKDPEPEKVKKFTIAELTNLLKECADVEKNGGYIKIAMKYGVRVPLVKDLEAKIKAEYDRRNTVEEPIEE